MDTLLPLRTFWSFKHSDALKHRKTRSLLRQAVYSPRHIYINMTSPEKESTEAIRCVLGAPMGVFTEVWFSTCSACA